MTAKKNESFWRLFLLLHKGCPLISRQLISKEIAKSGYDLDRLLFDNKKQLLEGKFGLDNAEIDILFPENKKTDIKHWDAHLFPCVILTLFSKSLKTVERKHIRSILNVQRDIESSMSEASLDPETYDEYKETLCEALRSLAHALNEQVENEITDLIDVLTTQSLNLQAITGTILQTEIKENLLHFLEKFPSYSGTVHSEGLSPQMVAYSNECNASHTVLEEIKTNVRNTRRQAEQTSDNKNTCISAGEANESTHDSTESLLDLRKSDSNEFGISDASLDGDNGTAASKTEMEETATGDVCVGREDNMTELEKGSDEIERDMLHEMVSNASKPMSEEERKSTELEWKNQDIEQCLKDKSFFRKFNNKMAQWEQEDVHVAVLGRTGVGKSSFVNAIRCCTSKEDPLYAPVGSVETTIERTAYPHPRNPRLILWDLPGIGTTTFSRKTYVKNKKISFQDYHIYLIMASDRFTEDETLLANEIDKIGKPFLFVRTKVDNDLFNVTDEKNEIEIIRNNCRKHLTDGNEVYLISSRYFNHPNLDSGQLLERLVTCLDGLKKQAMMYTLRFNTKLFIESKAAALQSRIKYVSITSAVGGGIPIPGLSFLVDWILISKEIDFYRKTLGVTECDLTELAEKTQKSVNDLKAEYKMTSFAYFKLATTDATKCGPILKQIAASEAVESSSKLFPVIGSVVAAGISCATTYHFLKSSLDMIVKDAKQMMAILLKETGSTVFPLNQKNLPEATRHQSS